MQAETRGDELCCTRFAAYFRPLSGSIPFTCSIEESPVTAGIPRVTGLFLSVYVPSLSLKIRTNWACFSKAYRSGVDLPQQIRGPPAQSMTNPMETERGNVMLTKDYVSLRLQEYKDNEKISLEARQNGLTSRSPPFMNISKGGATSGQTRST